MVEIKEVKKNKAGFDVILKFRGKMAGGIRKGFYESGKLLRNDARDGIKSPPKTGRMYKFKKTRRRASAPGEYPANRTGNLRSSIDFLVVGSEELQFFQDERGGRGGRTVKYGKFLEDGTRNMKARPFISKTVNKRLRDVQVILDRSTQGATK